MTAENLIHLIAQKCLRHSAGRIVGAKPPLLQQFFVAFGQQHFERGKRPGRGVVQLYIFACGIAGEHFPVVIQASDGGDGLRLTHDRLAQFYILVDYVIGRETGVGASQIHPEIHGCVSSFYLLRACRPTRTPFRQLNIFIVTRNPGKGNSPFPFSAIFSQNARIPVPCAGLIFCAQRGYPYSNNRHLML